MMPKVAAIGKALRHGIPEVLVGGSAVLDQLASFVLGSEVLGTRIYVEGQI